MHHELSVWTRGIIMDKEARDVAQSVAAAAEAEGYHSQYIADYVDDPDRTNCLIRKYSRFADQPFENPFIYENPNPDWVVLIEETIVKAVNFFRGTRDGEGVLVVNSKHEPEFLLRFLPEAMRTKLKLLVAVDAVGLAEPRGTSPWMYVRDLGELAWDRTSTEGAPERTPPGVGISAPLVGALVAATGVLPLESILDTVHEKDATRRGAEQYRALRHSAAGDGITTGTSAAGVP
jgi:hypothetical protein